MLTRVLNRVIRSLPPKYRLRALTALRLQNGSVDPELKRLTEYLPPNRRYTAIDVGANNGVTCSVLAKIFDKVHAFEPNPELTTGWENFAPRNVVVHTIALSDKNGEATLQIPIVHGLELSGWASLGQPGLDVVDGMRQIKVECKTLDSLGVTRQRIDFIKMDVEGHELAVLEGARECIARWQPWLVVEAWDRDAIVCRLAQMDYEVLPLETILNTRITSSNIALKPRSAHLTN